MRRLRPPSTYFTGRVWSADELTGLAAGWLDAIPDRIRSAPGVTAMVLGNHPEAVALFFARFQRDLGTMIVTGRMVSASVCTSVNVGRPGGAE